MNKVNFDRVTFFVWMFVIFGSITIIQIILVAIGLIDISNKIYLIAPIVGVISIFLAIPSKKKRRKNEK